MKVKISIVILMVFISISFTSCWNRRELRTIAIVESIIYDVDDEKNIDVTAEVLKPSESGGGEKGAGSGKNPFVVVQSKGKTASEALMNATKTFDLKLYYANNIARFYTEKIANNIIPSLDFVFRDHEMRQSAYVIIIKGENKDKLYSASLGLSETMGGYIRNISLSQKDTSPTSVFVDSLEFMRDYYEDGKQPVAGVVEIIKTEKQKSSAAKETSAGGISGGSGGNSSASDKSSGSEDVEYKIKYEGLAAFKDNRLVGFLDGIEARSYNFLTNHLKKAYITIPFEDGDTTVEVIKSKATIKTNLKNKQPVFDVTIKVGLVVTQENGSKDVSQDIVLKDIQNKFNKQLEGEINSAISKAQLEFKADIFGFGLYGHLQNPDEFRKIKLKWDETFCKAKINVKVVSSIDKSGEIKEPINMEENS